MKGITVNVETRYKLDCYRACLKPECPHCSVGDFHSCQHKHLAWSDDFHNLVVMEGRNNLLDQLFARRLTPGTLWYVGLKGSGSPADADTMNSHATWSEIVPYSEGSRPSFVPGTIANGTVSNSGTTATFSINATSTVYGAFLATSTVKSGTVGVLYGAGDLGTARQVQSTDTLNMRVDCVISST